MRGLFKQNPGLKLMSLLFAITLELYLYSPDNSVTLDLVVPVRLVNLPASKMVVGPHGEHGSEKGFFATVVVRAASPIMDQVKAGSYSFNIEVPESVQKTFTASFKANDLNLPRRVQVLDIQPEKIEFEVEDIAQRELRVVIPFEGEPDGGYRAGAFKIFPDRVRAYGPATELEGINIIETEKISVANLTKSKVFDVPLKSVGKLTALAVNTVSVEVPVYPIESTKTFNKLSITVVAPDGYAATVSPSKVDVTVAGPQRALELLQRQDIQLIADGRFLTDGKYLVDVGAKLPDGIKLIDSNPLQVELTVMASNG